MLDLGLLAKMVELYESGAYAVMKPEVRQDFVWLVSNVAAGEHALTVTMSWK